ncbi:MAG: hypothetical protein KIS81_07180 [Maricaulaceae bacterium]|nr:hypothetical protein [Maricaulaceae bacterium]
MSVFGFLKRFAAGRTGNTAMLFALALTPVVIGVGAAVDYGRAATVRNHMQQIADAAALEGMISYQRPDSERLERIGGVVSGHWTEIETRQPAPAWTAELSQDATRVSLRSAVPTTLMGIAGISEIDVAATALARAFPESLQMPLCILTLNLRDKDSLRNSGSGSITAPDCRVHVNSNNREAVNFSGGAFLRSGDNCIVGGVKRGSDISPAPSPDCAPVDDPFLNSWRPGPGVCDHDRLSISQNGTVHLQPGRYCHGLTINQNNSGRVVFAPGIYVIEGKFSYTGSGRMEGEGVSFYLDGRDAGLDWTGSGNYRFSAPLSGQSAGMLVSLNPAANRPLAQSTITGSGESAFLGTIYLPNQQLLIRGFESIDMAYGYALVVDTLRFSGRSSLAMAPSPVPVPRGLGPSARQRIVLAE